MRDKFMAGLIAGFIGGVAAIIFELVIANVFNFGQLSFLRFSGMMLYTHAPQNLVEALVATLVHLLFSSYMGVLFAYFLEYVGERYELVKGVIWSLAITWVIWTVTFLFKSRPEASIPENALENDISAAVYGLALAMAYRYIRAKSVVTAQGKD